MSPQPGDGGMVELGGWGRYPRLATALHTPRRPEALRPLQSGLRGYVARGAGRAYGDAATGVAATLDLRALNRLLGLDTATGTLTAEAGVTLGGMVAADIHGKSHHASGGFGAHLRALSLVLPSGEAVTCSTDRHAPLFHATIGGQGLTGTITEVTIALQPFETGWIRQRIMATPDLDATIQTLTKVEGKATYAVAWIDAVAQGRSLGRGAVFLGEHATLLDLAGHVPGAPRWPVRRAARLALPCDLPGAALNRYSVGAFNAVYHRRAAVAGDSRIVSFDRYFFPLDGISGWNRMYARHGFVQHQCVIPHRVARDVVAEILTRVAAAGTASFLAVLKSLAAGAGLLSFPLPGLTLALDIRRTAGSLRLLAELDWLVVAAGGRLYLAKDACQSAATFEAGYPGLAAFRALRRDIGAEGCIASRLSERLCI
jgi:FAD/FMN-containing dehydrogenase